MKTVILASVIAAIAVSLAMPVVADAETYAEKAQKRKKKTKKIDFIGDDVEGDVLNPDGANINVRPWATHASLIRIRNSFMKEIMKDAEDID